MFLSAILQWLPLAFVSFVLVLIAVVVLACLRAAALADRELESLTAALPRPVQEPYQLH